MDHERAQVWLDRYVAAWLSYDPDDIAALFSEDVVYRYHPNDDPAVGRDAVVAAWLGESASDTASTRDAPGTYQASGHDYRPDLPRFVSEVYGLPASEEQLARVAEAVRQREEVRWQVFQED